MHRLLDLPNLILRVLLPGTLRESVLGDMAELYGSRLEIGGRSTARRWYCRQWLLSCAAALRWRLTYGRIARSAWAAFVGFVAMIAAMKVIAGTAAQLLPVTLLIEGAHIGRGVPASSTADTAILGIVFGGALLTASMFGGGVYAKLSHRISQLQLTTSTIIVVAIPFLTTLSESTGQELFVLQVLWGIVNLVGFLLGALSTTRPRTYTGWAQQS